MKTTFILAAIISLSFLFSCDKSDDTVTISNCDGLITDTTGTGDNGKIFMPNAFTPNGDGLNDIIRPITQNVASIVFTIYDENNNIVFTTSILGQGWAAVSLANNNTKYYYKIQTVTAAGHHIGKCGELMYLTCFKAGANIALYDFEDELTLNGFTGVTAEHLATCP